MAMKFEERINPITNAEWELLTNIDNYILDNREFKWEEFINSITEEEAAAILKWLNRNVGMFTWEDWTINKEDIVKAYLVENALEAINNVILDDMQAIALWRCAQNCI